MNRCESTRCAYYGFSHTPAWCGNPPPPPPTFAVWLQQQLERYLTTFDSHSDYMDGYRQALKGVAKYLPSYYDDYRREYPLEKSSD